MEEDIIVNIGNDNWDTNNEPSANDFWIMTDRKKDMFSALSDFISKNLYTNIFVSKGSFDFSIGDSNFSAKTNSLVILKPGQEFKFGNISDDITITLVIISDSLAECICAEIQKFTEFHMWKAPSVVNVPAADVDNFKNLFKNLSLNICNIKRPFYSQALMFELLAFFFRTAYRCFSNFEITEKDPSSMIISQKFLSLVHTHHQEQRFLDFYAERLQITPKHLSRTVKKHTDISAVDWIEHYVIIDAKMLLRSTDLSIKEISEKLNFSSQSFFGKYFKKYVGVSPKEFRKGHSDD